MVYGGYDVEFELAVRGGLEDARVDLDLFDTGAVELFEGSDNAGLFASARGAIDEEMWEVAALCLRKVVVLDGLHSIVRCKLNIQELVGDLKALDDS